MYNLGDTVCAQSTPAGRGGIHIVRVSGALALDVLRKVFKPFPKKIVPNFVYYGKIFDSQTDETIDEVLVTYFEKGRSFTFEDTVEISCHGNPFIVRLILDLLVKNGCRMADRGEFTYRAFKNGRIDLAQAESVLTLIESNSKAFIDKALRQLDGQFTKTLLEVEDELIWVVSRLEAMLDFSTEDIEIESHQNIIKKLDSVVRVMRPLVSSFHGRSVLDRGIKTLILGPPNVGKSSLLNEFLGRKRAIVSDIAGTTRDFLSETTIINNKIFEMIDTAGLRSTDSFIESEGIQMAKDLVSTSDLVIVMLDHLNFESWQTYIDLVGDRKHILVVNKSDLLDTDKVNSAKNVLPINTTPTFFVSVLDQKGLKPMLDKMSELFDVQESESSLEVISVRQKVLLDSTLHELQEGIGALESGLSEEFVLSHLNSALKDLLSVRFIEDEEVVRDKIFKDFCLGK